MKNFYKNCLQNIHHYDRIKVEQMQINASTRDLTNLSEMALHLASKRFFWFPIPHGYGEIEYEINCWQIYITMIE